jgi:hypothetical protein
MSRSSIHGIADPYGQYQFQTELVSEPTDDTSRRHGVSHQLIASRRYLSTQSIPTLGPTTPQLAALVEQSIKMTVERGEETVVPRGVTIFTVFEATSGCGYVPVDVFVDGVSLDQLPIDRGFWRVPDRLCALIDRRSDRTVTHRQLAYDGAESPGERGRYSGHRQE